MFRSIKQLYGKALGTAEGEIGHVKDFYFNDQQWAVRYVIADTGTWLLGRLVLISPHAFGNFHQDGDCLLVNLTRQDSKTARQLSRISQSRDNMKRSIIVTMDGRPTGTEMRNVGRERFSIAVSQCRSEEANRW